MNNISNNIRARKSFYNTNENYENYKQTAFDLNKRVDRVH